MPPDWSLPEFRKGLRRIPRLFRDITHLEDNLLVESASKMLVADCLQVTENRANFPTTGSGAAQVTCSASWGQAPRLSSTLNTLAIVSPFPPSFQSVSKINISVIAPFISVLPYDSYNIPLGVWSSLSLSFQYLSPERRNMVQVAEDWTAWFDGFDTLCPPSKSNI